MKRAGDIIAALFDRGLMEKARSYSAFFSCWKDITEKNGIASAFDHSWIKRLEHGLVWIEADHPGWKQILQTKESKLLYDFRYRFPDMDISGISIALCRPGSRPEYTEAASESAVPEPEKPREEKTPAVKTGAASYDVIGEGSLKDALMRLEQSIIEKEASI